MKKFKFMPKLAAGMMAVAMTFGSLSGLGMNPVTTVYAADKTVKSITISGPDIVAAGDQSVTFNSVLEYSAEGDAVPANPTVTWKVDGGSVPQGKVATAFTNNANPLKVSADEQATELTITATSNNITSNSIKVIVADAVRLEIDYSSQNLPFHIVSTKKGTDKADKFLFLEVVKTESLTEKASATYCYEATNGEVYVDPSALKLTKGGFVRVYGDVNSKPVKVYKIPAQVTKPSVKYVAGKDTFFESFQYGKGKAALTAAAADNLQWKLPSSNEWNAFVDKVTTNGDQGLEKSMDSLRIAGSTILVREVSEDGSAMPSAEVKVKISAAPKAPKVTLDYAKNTIKLAKNSKIRILSSNTKLSGIPIVDKDGKLPTSEPKTTPFYYTVGTSKDDLNTTPADLAKKVLDAYVKARNEAAAKLTGETDKGASYKITTEPTTSGQTTTPADDDVLLEAMLKDGYKFLLSTTSNKGDSQPVFVDVKAAPVIEIRRKNEGNDTTPKYVDENVIAVVTGNKKDTDGDDVVEDSTSNRPVREYANDTLTYVWSVDDGLTLTPSVMGSFAYSLDGGEKYSVLKKATTIKLDKIDKNKGVKICKAGAKDDPKKNIIGNWASEAVSVPVAVKEVKIECKTEFTAVDNTGVSPTLKVKDFFDADVTLTDADKKDIKWEATGTTSAITFATDSNGVPTFKVTALPASDTKVTITATYKGVKGTIEITVKKSGT